MEHIAKEINVFDDLVPAHLRQSLSELVRGPIWQYGWRSNTRRDRFCFWHASFAGGGIESRANCEMELSKNAAAVPVYELWKLLSSGPLKGHEPLRVYANSHTYGVEGYVHTDNDDTENYFSTIYYAHQTWHKNWSGETLFFTRDGQDIVKAVYPSPGRIVSFPGSLPHAAHAPSRECAELRVSIVFKSQKAPV
ncbi:2OG-Fe(II) oxygenase [Burkholderia territorii]|uniref:2OG-Fe(II) oxygenase n=1 Tax=Burkholderia territorii TaxID=1503055 RepID=UPI0014534263|nr:2OG-Fe(II) oxygenase [Burkholderia territorii]MBM2772021.1 hypothetical protein [Burkholderia territorii]VWB80019.1 BcaB [Burkholderia territorii]